MIPLNLMVHMVFLAIELGFLAASDVSTIGAGISLLLVTNSFVFRFELSVVTAQASLICVDSVIDVAIAMKNFGAARMPLCEVLGLG